MGLGLRIFLVHDDDSLKRLPMTRYKRLLRREPEECLPQYSGKRIRYALVVVDFVDRRPVEIAHVQYSILSFDSEGRIDQVEKGKEARLAMEVRPPLLSVDDSSQVVHARHRFAKKRYDDRYTWKPTIEIQAKIAAAIFGTDPG
jgi:hypothetical protein